MGNSSLRSGTITWGRSMNAEDLGNSKILNLLFKPAGMVMGSRLRQRLINPTKTLRGADIQPGQTVLEVGCGTGFFTLPAAQLIGNQGCLVAMDVSSNYIERVSKKVQAADTVPEIGMFPSHSPM